MSSEPLITTIEAHHKRALLNATGGVSFHFHEGQGSIRAHRGAEHTASGFDETVTIFTDTVVVDYQRDGARAEDGRQYACFHMEMYRPEIEMLSLIARMRTGDTLRLKWVHGNDNENDRRIGWHRDELYLGIKHAKGRDERYLVEAKHGPDNTARMVRVA